MDGIHVLHVWVGLAYWWGTVLWAGKDVGLNSSTFESHFCVTALSQRNDQWQWKAVTENEISLFASELHYYSGDDSYIYNIALTL